MDNYSSIPFESEIIPIQCHALIVICMQVNERIEESGKECKQVTFEFGVISYSWNFAELLETAAVSLIQTIKQFATCHAYLVLGIQTYYNKIQQYMRLKINNYNMVYIYLTNNILNRGVFEFI